MLYRELFGTQKNVSLLGLGSYETLCYLEYKEIVDLVSTAFELGITLFDVARYPRAPHTEVILMRALKDAGIPREEYTLVTKVWGRDEQSMQGQLDESLFRLGLESVDGVLCYGPRWDVGDPVKHASEVAGLVESGRAAWWGGLNWASEDIDLGMRTLSETDRPGPVLMQMKYNVARRSIVESADYLEIWNRGSLLLQASDSLEGGILAGKEGSQRVLGRDPGAIRDGIRDRIPELRMIATDFGVTLAQLSLIYAASFPFAANVLVGSSRPEQLRQNAAAIDLVETVGDEVRARLSDVEIVGHRLDVPPGTIVTPEDSPYAVARDAGA